MLGSQDFPGAEHPDRDRADYAYLLSFENDRNFLARQGVALALLAAAGFIEFPHTHPVHGVRHLVLPAALAIAAIFIMVAALRHHHRVDKAIRATNDR